MLSVYLFGPQGLPRLQSKAKLRKLCAEMADDGFLSIEKIEEGYDANDDFKNTLREMGIERQDLRTVFALLEPYLGRLAHDKFCDGLFTRTEEACLLAVRCRSCAKQSRAQAHETYSKARWQSASRILRF